MCLNEIITNPEKLSPRLKKKYSLIQDGCIGYKFFGENGYAFRANIHNWYDGEWAYARYDGEWAYANTMPSPYNTYKAPRKILSYDYEEYFAGFHLYYNLSAAINNGTIAFGRISVYAFECRNIITIGFDGYLGRTGLCIVAQQTRLLKKVWSNCISES